MGETDLDITSIDEPWQTEIRGRISRGFDFNTTVSDLSKKGYNLDATGVMLRETLFETASLQPDSTVLDIAFLRKSDVHKHLQVEEVAKTIGGKGRVYFSPKFDALKTTADMEILQLTPPKTVSIPPLMPHAFVPCAKTYLEISLVTLGGKLGENGDEEIELVKFNEWELEDY